MHMLIYLKKQLPYWIRSLTIMALGMVISVPPWRRRYTIYHYSVLLLKSRMKNTNSSCSMLWTTSQRSERLSYGCCGTPLNLSCDSVYGGLANICTTKGSLTRTLFVFNKVDWRYYCCRIILCEPHSASAAKKVTRCPAKWELDIYFKFSQRYKSLFRSSN